MAIECDYKLKCKHQSNNGFHSIIFEQKDEKREKINTDAFDFRQLRPTVKYWKYCVSWRLCKIVARTFDH